MAFSTLDKIDKEVYEFALREGYADKNLIAKWKKQGYERLCCLRCIQPKDTNYGTTCICRVIDFEFHSRLLSPLSSSIMSFLGAQEKLR